VGDKTAPCGTPARIGEMLEISEPELTDIKIYQIYLFFNKYYTQKGCEY